MRWRRQCAGGVRERQILRRRLVCCGRLRAWLGLRNARHTDCVRKWRVLSRRLDGIRCMRCWKCLHVAFQPGRMRHWDILCVRRDGCFGMCGRIILRHTRIADRVQSRHLLDRIVD